MNDPNNGLPEPTSFPSMPAVAPPSDEMTVVPILVGFDQAQVIGELRIKTSALPPTPDYVFTLGFQALHHKFEPGSVPTAEYVDAYELLCVSLIHDENYVGYLRQIGKLPPVVEPLAI